MKKTILLCGATGYLGSHLLKKLISDYTILIAKRSYSRTGRIEGILDKCSVYDIDKRPIEDIFKENRIDIILNTVGNYGRKDEPLEEVVTSNLVFPVALLDNAIKYQVPCFIHTGTILNKYTSAYALSKGQFSEWLKYYSGYLTVLNIKLEHFYGPGDDSTKFIANIISRIIKKEKEIKLSSGEQKRDFIFIDDAVAFYDLILKNSDQYDKGFHEFHVGSGTSHRIRDLVDFIIKISKSSINPIFGAIPDRKHEPVDSKADISFLGNMGFHISTDIYTGLKKTWEAEINQTLKPDANEYH
jgi:nucleoside-diphosphate-sugar epimerase